MLTAVCLAAGAEDEALVGAALIAGGHAGVPLVLGVVAGESLRPLAEPSRVDYPGVRRQRAARLRGRRGHGGAQHHQYDGDRSQARWPGHCYVPETCVPSLIR